MRDVIYRGQRALRILGVIAASVIFVGCVGIVDGEAPRRLSEAEGSEGVTQNEGSGSGTPRGSAPASSGYALVQTVLEDNCVGCHSDDSLGVAFGEGDVHATLLKHTLSACDGKALVKPGDVQNS